MQPSENVFLNIDQTLQTICQDLQYLSLDPFGNLVRKDSLSTQQDRAALRSLIAAHEFVSYIWKSSRLPYNVSRDLSGIHFDIDSTAASLFNISIASNFSHLMEGIRRPSIQAEIFFKIAMQLGILNFQFQGIPNKIINTDGVLEADLVDSFSRQLLEAVAKKSSGVDEYVRQQDAQTKGAISSFNRLSKRMSNWPEPLDYLIIKIQPSHGSEGNSLDDSIRLGQNYFTEVTRTLNDQIASFWWRRDHKEPVGYTYFAVIFFPARNDFTELMRVLHQLWSVASGAKSGWYAWVYNTQNPNSAWSSWQPHNKLEELQRGIERTVTAERYWGLQHPDRLFHYGYSKPSSFKPRHLFPRPPPFSSII